MGDWQILGERISKFSACGGNDYEEMVGLDDLYRLIPTLWFYEILLTNIYISANTKPTLSCPNQQKSGPFE